MEKKFNFSDSPLQDYLHKRWIAGEFEIDPDEIYTNRYNLTNKLDDDIKFRTLNKKNYIISLYGFTGIGKSTVAQYWAWKTHKFIMSKFCQPLVEEIQQKYGRKPEFDVSNICFDISELLKRLAESVPMETFIYDEAGSEKLTGSGSMREKWDKQRIMKRVRILQHNFFLCDPLIDDSKMGQLHLYKIQPVQIDYENELNRSILHACNENSVYVPVGHLITKKMLVEGYEEKKSKQARDVEISEFGGDRAKTYQKIANRILKEGVADLDTGAKMPITNYKRQDWTAILETETRFQYAKDEIKIIGQIIRAKTARKWDVKK